MNLELLPPGFWYDEIYETCTRISERYQLSGDQRGQMDAAVRDFLGGYVGNGYFALHLRKNINDSADDGHPPITEAIAGQIAADIKRELLAPIRDILGSVHPHWVKWLS